MLASIPPFQRDARSKGIPSLGAGAIYPVSEDDILCDAFTIPPYWPRAYGLDVGWNKTAGMWGAWDRDTDTIYITAEHYAGQAEPAVHAAAIRAKGDWMLGVIDPASRGRSQHDGQRLLDVYREHGLILTPADNGVEAGLFEVLTRMTTGRLKVFRQCTNWLREFRLYQRDEKGRVKKQDDHLMDAMRYLVVSGLSVARVPPNAIEQMRPRQAWHPHAGL